MQENLITDRIIASAIKVHRNTGPGLLESAYQACLFYELQKSGLKVEQEKPCPLIYENIKLNCGYRLDLLVENKVIVELKAVEALNEVHFAQTLTYLKLMNLRIGLLINFNVSLLKNGIRRIANGY